MNVCNCPEPPGGNVTCRDDQLAICAYQHGRIVGGCYDKPGYIGLLTALHEGSKTVGMPRLDNLALCNWVISTTTGLFRGDVEPLDDNYLAILRSRKYEDWTGRIVTFSLPRTLQPELNSVADGSHLLARLGRRDLEKLNLAMAQLRKWYEQVLANPASAEERNREISELARQLHSEADRKKGLLKRWTGEGKKRSSLSELGRAREVFALWMELLGEASL
jgi:hypothetical protein